MVSKQDIYCALQRSNRRTKELEALMDESKVYELYKPYIGRRFKVREETRVFVPLVSGTRYYYDLEKGIELKIIDLILYASVTHQEDFQGYYWMEKCFVVEGMVRHELGNQFWLDEQPLNTGQLQILVLDKLLVPRI